ncbi:MAG TPA: alkaline phosphatase D family protein [Polyangiaceae bacterium]|nr:alkaline phosphatase D family protein [Polyangiaceae bacterium]
MKVREPSVGPIVGATGAGSVRILVRGELELEGGKPRRAHGVARLRERGREFGPPRFFKLNPNFDLTGVVVFEGLSPETAYDYEAGWFFSEADSAALDASAALDWAEAPRRGFTTASGDGGRERSFVFGSCRYLLRLFGGAWFDDRSDKTFGSIVRQIEAGRRTDAFLMIGDQIYADDLDEFRADQCVDGFFARYRDAFTTRGLRELMARVPTYMTLDDHEIEDDWPARAARQDHVRKLPAAMHAYQVYQLSHSPAQPARGGKLEGTPGALSYAFTDGCADVFVTDTRTERVLDEGARRIVSPEQLAALQSFLGDGSGRVKIVVSSVPLFGAAGVDKWEGFFEQRDALLGFIRENKVRRVLALSGDVHASFTAELGCDDDPDFKIVSVVSSPFFWPYRRPLAGHFQTQGYIRSEGKYRVTACTPIVIEDNFTRITVDPRGVRVEVFGRKGGALGQSAHAF